jgi:hypothetical protein
MDIARRQQLPFTLLEPADAGVALTSWALVYSLLALYRKNPSPGLREAVDFYW